MVDIDFLPAQYRRRHAQRKAQPWRVVVVSVFVLLVAAASLGQHYCWRRAEEDLAAVLPQYELTASQAAQLAESQAQLAKVRTSAELFTYLRHPWPRTQLLLGLLAPLPNEIVFDALQITREKLQGETPGPQRPGPAKNEESLEDRNRLSPAELDLKRLREEFDPGQMVIQLSGTTADPAALHAYLGELGSNGLFTKVDLDVVERSDGKEDGRMRFRALLVVRPGYGQPGGPPQPHRSSVARASVGDK
jgi:hypothetical protein